jgi:aromatic ring hydroxylase
VLPGGYRRAFDQRDRVGAAQSGRTVDAGIDAHLTSAIALAQRSPAGLLMPHQSMLYAGRVFACSNLPRMMHIAHELCGGQICVTPNAAAFQNPGPQAGSKSSIH